MIHSLSIIRLCVALVGLTFLFVSGPAFAGEQQCTFCSQSAVSQESGPPEVNIGTQQGGSQHCSFCAGVQGGGATMSSPERDAAKTIPSKTIMAASMSPAEGFGLHVQAPHMMADGKIGGPFHHFCKGISKEILQCLLFKSTDPNAPLVAVEYFIAKTLARKEVPLIKWNRNFHDHEVEIATGRVQILGIADQNKVKEIAAVAAKTDGIIFHLWPDGQKIPDGTVSIPNSVGHKFRTE